MNLKRRVLVLLAYLPYASLVTVSFVLSSMRRVPIVSDVTFWQADKVFHFFGFMGMGFLAAIAASVEKGGWLYAAKRKAFLLAFCYAAFDEIHQFFVPMRSFSLWDLAADSAGILVGFKLFSIFIARFFSAPSLADKREDSL
jgi:VanZ family protein